MSHFPSLLQVNQQLDFNYLSHNKGREVTVGVCFTPATSNQQHHMGLVMQLSNKGFPHIHRHNPWLNPQHYTYELQALEMGIVGEKTYLWKT